MVIIGMLPTSYLYAFGGDAIIKGDLKRIIAALLIIVVGIAIYKLIEYRRERQESITKN
ncbi:hypothetical protein FC35_GL001378 [Limosilactobacillus coleohominis DSM 14060]|nr:hypothetical protein FC35_GL001378 [Limosilactobacillus coleohominis DSM 14060]